MQSGELKRGGGVYLCAYVRVVYSVCTLMGTSSVQIINLFLWTGYILQSFKVVVILSFPVKTLDYNKSLVSGIIVNYNYHQTGL